MCIRYRGNSSTEPLPSNDRGYTWTDGRDVLIRLFRCLRCRDICTKFHKDWFRHSEVNRGHTHTHTQERDLISLLCFFFFQNKESRLEIIKCFIL
jgi:uncharacterized C2H2 Zn-finger protein